MDQAEPESPPSGPVEGVPSHAELMQPSPGGDRLGVLAHEVGGRRQTLQIIGPEPRYPIARRQRGERPGPLPAIECRPGPTNPFGRSHASL